MIYKVKIHTVGDLKTYEALCDRRTLLKRIKEWSENPTIAEIVIRMEEPGKMEEIG